MKVLLAVSVSDATPKAVEFLGKSLAAGEDVEVTVLHVVETLPAHFLVLPQREKLRGVADTLSEVSRESGAKLLEEVRDRLVADGWNADHVQTKTIEVDALPESQHVSAAAGITREMKEGAYDVVVLGRRGTSAAEGNFVGSVAQHILREARGVTVCVVD